MAVLGEPVSPWDSCWMPGKAQQTVLVSLCLQKGPSPTADTAKSWKCALTSTAVRGDKIMEFTLS